MNIKSIFVPVDFSIFSEKALNYAIHLAKKFNASITIFHAALLFQEDVNEEKRMEHFTGWLKTQQSQLDSQMDEQKELVEGNDLPVKTVIERGVSTADAILDYLETTPHDIIIMGTHGRTGLKHLFLGSVAEKISRLASIPVLTVHRSVNEVAINKILVPIDFSIYSQHAVETACRFAEMFGAQLHFIHVVEQEVHPSFYSVGVSSVFEVDNTLPQRVIENMKGFTRDITQGMDCHYIVKEGKAHKEIVETAEQIKSDLIVIASHGLTGLDYILLGSTSEKVIRWAKNAVLVVK
ncbi:MAG: universal stress protein [Calditrichia bacterium]